MLENQQTCPILAPHSNLVLLGCYQTVYINSHNMNAHKKHHRQIPVLFTALACLLLIPVARGTLRTEVKDNGSQTGERQTRNVVRGICEDGEKDAIIDIAVSMKDLSDEELEKRVRGAFAFADADAVAVADADDYVRALKNAYELLGAKEEKESSQIAPAIVDMRLRGLEALERAIDAGYRAHTSKGYFKEAKFVRKPWSRFHFSPKKLFSLSPSLPWYFDENLVEKEYKKIKQRLKRLIKSAERSKKRVEYKSRLTGDFEEKIKIIEEVTNRLLGDEKSSKNSKDKCKEKAIQQLMSQYIKDLTLFDKSTLPEEKAYEKSSFFTVGKAACAVAMAALLALLERKFNIVGLFDSGDDEGPFGDLDDEEYDEEYDKDDKDDQVDEEDEE